MSVTEKAVRPPNETGVAGAGADADRSARLVHVTRALGECLAELQDLGLTLPAALVDNAIAEIK